MMCANCSSKFEAKASRLPEIAEINVNYASAKINIKLNENIDKQTVFEKLNKLCTQIEPKAHLSEQESSNLGLNQKIYNSKKSQNDCNCDSSEHDILNTNNKHFHNEDLYDKTVKHTHEHSHDHSDLGKQNTLSDHKKELILITITLAILALAILYS